MGSEIRKANYYKSGQIAAFYRKPFEIWTWTSKFSIIFSVYWPPSYHVLGSPSTSTFYTLAMWRNATQGVRDSWWTPCPNVDYRTATHRHDEKQAKERRNEGTCNRRNKQTTYRSIDRSTKGTNKWTNSFYTLKTTSLYVFSKSLRDPGGRRNEQSTNQMNE